MREFHTAVKATLDQETEREGKVTFLHDGTEVTFYFPTTAQFAAAMSVSSDRDVNVMIGFIFEMMDEDTKRYFRRRLLDSFDPFDLEGEGSLMEVYEALTEEWSARPTKSPSDFSSSQKPDGRKSTAKRASKVSTSST